MISAWVFFLRKYQSAKATKSDPSDDSNATPISRSLPLISLPVNNANRYAKTMPNKDARKAPTGDSR